MFLAAPFDPICNPTNTTLMWVPNEGLTRVSNERLLLGDLSPLAGVATTAQQDRIEGKLDRVLERVPVAPDGLLTREQAADLVMVSPSTIDRWRKRSKDPLPAHRKQGVKGPRFKRDEILAWFERTQSVRVEHAPPLRLDVRTPPSKPRKTKGAGDDFDRLLDTY